MEINKINPLFETTLSSTRRTEQGAGFKEILKQRLDEINPVRQPAADDPRQALLSQGDKILNLLESYADALADPARTLKDIAPMVRDIEDNVRAIDTLMASETGGEVLQQTLNDLTLTANVAMLKFNRGDFVS